MNSVYDLELGYNKVTDLRPLGGLKSLTSLNVSEFSSLKGLTWLNLDTNGITDVAPLQTLTGLTNLSLRGNRVVDVAPLAKLVKLDWLMLAHNRITIVAPLAKLPMLDVLHLWDNPIVDKTSLEPLIAAGVDVRFTDPGGFLPWSLPDPVEES